VAANHRAGNLWKYYLICIYGFEIDPRIAKEDEKGRIALANQRAAFILKYHLYTILLKTENF